MNKVSAKVRRDKPLIRVKTLKVSCIPKKEEKKIYRESVVILKVSVFEDSRGLPLIQLIRFESMVFKVSLRIPID